MRRSAAALFLAFIIVVFIPLGLAGNAGASGDYELVDTKGYMLVEAYVLKNTGNVAADRLEVSLLLGKKANYAYQDDIELSVQPRPNETYSDKYMNMYAKYIINNVAPGQRIIFTIKRLLENSGIQYSVDLSSASSDYSGFSEYSLYTAPSDKIQSDNENIIKTAREITGSENNPYKKARKIYNYVNSHMEYDTSADYGNKGALSALLAGRGVCEEYATLFTALCRASGVPARVVSGFWLQNDELAAIGNTGWYKGMESLRHAWAEFYLPDFGWIPVEPTITYTVNGQKTTDWGYFANLDANGHISNRFDSLNVNVYDCNYSYYSSISDPSAKPDFEITGSSPKIMKVDTRFLEYRDAKPQGFEDVPSGHWAAAAITEGRAHGIISGYPGNMFEPGNNITRIEFMTMLDKALGVLDTGKSAEKRIFYFPDYDLNNWSKGIYDDLALRLENVEKSGASGSGSSGDAAQEKGAGYAALTRVFGKDSLNMNKYITREEAVALMDGFLKMSDGDYLFTDIDGSIFKKSIIKANQLNIISGYDSFSFGPARNINRAEAAMILKRFLMFCNLH